MEVLDLVISPQVQLDCDGKASQFVVKQRDAPETFVPQAFNVISLKL